MGCYVNPPEVSKESWLELNAKPRGVIIPAKQVIPAYSDFPEGTLPVVLLDNGRFTAVGIAYDEREYAAFTDTKKDFRPRFIYEAKVDDLMRVSDLVNYLN